MPDLSARQRSAISKGDRLIDPFVIYAARGPDRQTVGSDRTVAPSAADAQGQARKAVEGPARGAECSALDSADWSSMGRPAGSLPAESDLPPTISVVGGGGDDEEDPSSTAEGPRQARENRLGGDLRGRQLCLREKG